jgi:hypothetical protein
MIALTSRRIRLRMNATPIATLSRVILERVAELRVTVSEPDQGEDGGHDEAHGEDADEHEKRRGVGVDKGHSPILFDAVANTGDEKYRRADQPDDGAGECGCEGVSERDLRGGFGVEVERVVGVYHALNLRLQN